MTPGEARLATKNILNAPDAVAAAGCAIDLEAIHPDLDQLKSAEYGLLVEPITQGVEAFLARPEIKFNSSKPSLNEIAEHVGTRVATATLEILGRGERERLVKDIAGIRRDTIKITRSDIAQLVFPIDEIVHEAAKSSAHNSVTAAVANAVTIARATGNTLTHDERVAATRASHHLALAHPMVHIGNMNMVTAALQANMARIVGGRTPTDEILRYDPISGKSVLAKDLERWRVDHGTTIKDTLDRNPDVRIGCPFSFAPKDVRVGYYEKMVDLIEEHNVWPSFVARLASYSPPKPL